MADATCSVDRCERPVHARGMCSRCYMRWYSANPDMPKRPYRAGASKKRGTVEERFWRKVRQQADGCWLWSGAIDVVSGYGRFRPTKSAATGYAHRFAYEFVIGPIPEGLHLDHLCRVRNCVNPAHLEPVTCLENIRRGQGNGSKTHCPQGHPYAGDNLQTTNGRRRCATCNRERVKAWRDERKAQRSEAA